MSILAADPTRGIASIGASDTAGGVVARTLLPIMPLAIFVIGWARLEGQLAGLYDTRFGLALMVILSAAVCVLAITWTAFELRKVDLVRRRAEAKIAGLNAGLEELVQQRTEQVARLTAALSANKALELLSLQDCLTGVGNRRSFDQYLAGQTSIARRQKRTLALVMCDIDDFKAYNDHYGHQAGDACLKRVAAALRSICRRPADMTARYGGEEFALILPDTDLAGAILIAEAARDAVACLKIPHARSPAALHVSISGGVSALLPTTELTSWKLIADADEALFQAKRQGRNRMISAPAETKENLAAAKVRAVA
jgi:diguanylate cyclase (GGDEF)-like protein